MSRIGHGSGALLLVVLLTGVLGCGNGQKRVAVRGRVTFEGKPVARGAIRFLPNEKTQAPMSGGVILDGQYTVAQGGVPVGTHRVEIEAYEGGSTTGDVNVPDAKQYLPPRYNKKSELSITITADSGPITKDYDLTR